jgi:hypothetical protein
METSGCRVLKSYLDSRIKRMLLMIEFHPVLVGGTILPDLSHDLLVDLVIWVAVDKVYKALIAGEAY